MARIYCAGPLFSPGEQGEMQQLAAVLEAAGHETFLPQRDGIELVRLEPALVDAGCSPDEASRVSALSVFHFDTYKLLAWADGVAANLNGRTPDEGTVVEAALAWHSGKALVFYKCDPRAPFAGSDNPMLAALTGLDVVSEIDDLPAAIDRRLAEDPANRVERVLHLGKGVAEARLHSDEPGALARALLAVLKEGEP